MHVRAVQGAVHGRDAGRSPAGAARDASRSTICSHETLLLLEDGHCLRDQALDICSSTDVHEKQDFRATSLETLRQMVAAGVGITLLPELAGRGAYGNARGVAIRPFAKPVPTRTIGAVWRKSSARRAVHSRARASRSRRTRCESCGASPSRRAAA